MLQPDLLPNARLRAAAPSSMKSQEPDPLRCHRHCISTRPLVLENAPYFAALVVSS